MRKVAILQSNYIPWKGYFDIIGHVDAFMFHDDIQYTKQDWRNRNLIKTENGLTWLTAPVSFKSDTLICDVSLVASDWQKSHFNQIFASYNRAPYFKYLLPFLELIYLKKKWVNLSELNQFIIKKICKDFLKINTNFLDSRKFVSKEKKMARVLDLLKKAGATHYLSGPAAKDYIEEDVFLKEGIKVQWMVYSYMKKYTQLYNNYEDRVSIIDLLVHTGPNVREYMLFNK
ncbi:WbqC family protein [Methylophilales bacterium]|nr:WbqC family protein [Methylophilales bacterium]